MLSTVLRDNFCDNGHDCSAHETDSELQLLRCLFPKLQYLSDPACQRSSDSGPACFQCIARYPWWGSAFGVGGRGRSPIDTNTNPPTPRVRRAGRQGRPVKGTVSLHSCKREMGGWGAETGQECCWVPEMVLPLRRFAIFGLGGSAGRPRVPEGDSGGLPEFMLGSPKVILDLSGGHFGFFEGHF